MGKFVDLSGKVFNEWTVLSRDPVQTTNMISWVCKCSCGNIKSVVGTNVTRGISKSCGKCNQIIYGFGVNDLCRTVTDDPIYFTWKRMIERCYAEVTLEKYPTYQDKHVSQEWKFATKFEEWMVRQSWEGMELDKDLLVLGNKEYGPSTCSFVPKKINLVLGTSDGKRGDYMLGVCLHSTARHKFQSRCGQTYLGLFDDEMSAHKVWQKAKAQDILKTIDWWGCNSDVKHTFNEKIAENLFYISSKLLEDSKSGVETKNLLFKEN